MGSRLGNVTSYERALAGIHHSGVEAEDELPEKEQGSPIPFLLGLRQTE